jgi:integral membrane protein (TIGR01906 family)
VTRRAASAAVFVLVAVATTVVIVALAVLPFLTPAWVLAGQQLVGADEFSGYTPAELGRIDAALLGDHLLGPPDFDVAVDGEAVLAERERQHMRDVRTVFLGLFGLAIVSLLVLAVAWRAEPDRARAWRRFQQAGIALVATVIATGVVVLVAFEPLFALFHQLLFPAGTYTFDPATERLVRLFPLDFWSLSTIAVGAVVVVLAVVLVIVAGRRSAPVTAVVAESPAAPSAAGEVAP